MEAEKNKCTQALMLLCAAGAAGCACGFAFMKSEDSTGELEQDVWYMEEEVPAAERTDVQATLVYSYSAPWEEMNLGGLQLIDGSQANRTMYVMKIDGPAGFADTLKSLRLYEDGQSVVLDVRTWKAGNAVLAVLVCDGAREYTEDIVLRAAVKEDGKALERFTVPVEAGTPDVPDSVDAGNFIMTSSESWWLRLPEDAGQTTAKTEENVWVRSIPFFAFGKDLTADRVQFQTELSEALPWNCELNAEIRTVSGETGAGLKMLEITLKIKDGGLRDEDTEQVCSALNAAEIRMGTQTIKNSAPSAGAETEGRI